MEFKYYDPSDKKVKSEKLPGDYWIRWFYHNPAGKFCTETYLKRRIVSSTIGRVLKLPVSKPKIRGFVRKYSINMDESEKQIYQFKSFNDFFIRKLKKGVRNIDRSADSIVSPADGKVLGFSDVSKINSFFVKGHKFTVSSFLRDRVLSEKYRNGAMLIIRLAPMDYHRFHFPVSGKAMTSRKINGHLYSVSPYAVAHNISVFLQNKREYTIIKSSCFGDVVMSEIGATMVGSIRQTYKLGNVRKGQEKGYFEFGGSTVILLFEKGRVRIDPMILRNTRKNLETKVLMGERIAVRK